MRKRSLAVVALTVSAALYLAACGGSSAAGSGGSAEVSADSAAGFGSSDSANAGGTGAGAGNAAGTTGSASKEKGDPADKFVYHTSAEMLAFMEPYMGVEELNWREPKWELNGDEINISGSLTPDKSAFTSVSATYRLKKDGKTPPEELLWTFYEDLCDKTGTTFPEAEESIRKISSMEDRLSFENGSLTLQVNKYSNNCEVGIYRTDASIDSIPYTPSDAAAFMENAGGKTAEISRTVTDTPKVMSGLDDQTYEWTATLDADERIRHINAEYYGEDPAEGKAFFTALTEFFLTGDVLDQGKKLLDEHYDTIEVKDNEKAEMDKPYSMTLQRRSDYYSVSISVKAENVPSDAPVFPSAEELAMLQLDPIARLGIDKTAELPETVIYEHEGMKITLERSYYDTFPELMIEFRVEGLSENGYAEVYVDKINGQEIDLTGIAASVNSASLSSEQPVDAAFIKLSDLKELLPDFTGLESVTVTGGGRADISDITSPGFQFSDVTVEAR